jgi:predicted SprT family Zn-dependent metalloprotease
MNREELIAKARDIVNQDVVKGFTADFLKMAANDTVNPSRFETYLKNISEQAWDPGTEENTILTYSQELVDIVKELFPKNPDYPYLQENGLNSIKIANTKIKKKTEKNINEIKTLIKSILRESTTPAINEAREHTNDEIVDFNEIDLQHEYNKLNQQLFNGNLQPVTMLWNKRKGAHGVVKGKRNRNTGKITLTSLSMSQFLKVPYKFFKDVLAHEMIHVFWMQQDVNAKHGPLFKQEMNRINSMGLGFNVSVTSDSSETSKFEVSQDAVKPGMQLVCLLMDTDKSKNMLSVMKYDAYKKEAHNIIKIYDYLINEQPKYKFAEGEFLLSTNPKLQAKTIQRNFRRVSYAIVDDALANELKQNAKFLSKFVINNDGPHVEGPDQPNPAPPKSLLGF